MFHYPLTPSKNKRARRRGSVLVEFAAVVVIFLTLLLGMLQFGVYLNATNTLWNLSREGARYASVQVPGSTSSSSTAIAAQIKNIAPPQINTAKLVVVVDPDSTAARPSGNEVTVKLTYDMSDKMFLPTGFIPTGLKKSYTTTTTMRVE